ncbi:endomembrane protein 70 [Achaetomium macrosporum]|uniref:Transmembrane 9 superfamily member n=1 Tax=Achaetomium macrosporum TaxID=79813 RepID=A0AAN7C3N3_9PEZI|nr:endomembrane protein 70 [Achaetomium macrosporum]
MKPPVPTLTLPLHLLLLLLVLHSPACAFYIPGWSIRSYTFGQPLPLLANKVYSDRTQLQYAYYDLPFVCPPTGRHRRRIAGAGLLSSGQSAPLNLGEVLRGDRIVVSDVGLIIGKDRAREMVAEGYRVGWIVDNLPGATSFVTVDKTRKYYAGGFKLGSVEDDDDAGTGVGRKRYYLNNHHTIIIRYRKAPGKAGETGGKAVVGFEVYPTSIGPREARGEDGCPVELGKMQEGFELLVPPRNRSTTSTRAGLQGEEQDGVGDDDVKVTIPYTYSVYFREDNSIEWNHRWDLYFVNQEEGARVHWMAILNSLIICGLLTAVVLTILTRTVRSDIHGYKQGMAEGGKLRKRKDGIGQRMPIEKTAGLLDQPGDTEKEGDLSDDEALEDVAGWKVLNGDVFRPPRHGHLLAPLVGSGMQLLFMAVGLILLSAMGVLNPSFRGGFISFGVGLFVFAGLFSGYFSARVYKTFGGRDWRRNTMVTAVLFPGLLFAVASSTAIPFGTLVAMVALWLGIQAPLVSVGSRYGFLKAGSWEHPTKTSAIPRQIPFAVIFIELLFVFQSVWQDKGGYYYVFGFLAVVSTILLVTVAEVTVVTIYLQLCSENYHWRWQSFLIGGGSAVWVFLYCVWYYSTKLHITGVLSSMLSFAYGFMACCMYGLLTGTVGFLTAYAFVRRIYG